jgi:hypothetical protein
VPAYSVCFNYNVECVGIERLHALVIGGLIIFINNSVKCVGTEGASRPGDRRINYFYK